MKRNMKQWVADMIAAPKKLPLPVLSFPAIQKMGITVKELINDSDLQAQAMKIIADSHPTAASVSLMDLSLEAECFGSEIRFSDDEVPTVIGAIVEDEDAARALQVPQVGTCRSQIYIDAIRKAVDLITDRPVLAGMIGPFSLAGRLIGVSEAMILCYEEPDMVEMVLDKATEFLIKYAQAYKDAGANGVIVAEPLAGMLSPSLEEDFAAPYMKKLVDAVQDDQFIIVYHNCGDNTVRMIDSLSSSGCLVYHFGNAINMEEMMEHMPENMIACGNVDPAGAFRNGTPQLVREQTLQTLQACSKYPNFVISSGCDIPPMSSWDNIDAFFETVEEFYGEQ